MKAIISVIGKDTFGILAKVSAVCSENRANISDVTQSILQDMFVMVMLVDISDSGCDFSRLRSSLAHLADEMGMQINLMHEDIFNSMHRI
ncbi:MAG: ACT domain-containing protein [Ruminococcaceae bacterium]|nr:ACT domain-containing protein [Oscillospiraceae bacterium]